MNQNDLLFLLKGGHVNMPARIEKGIWPHPPLNLKDCIAVIVKVLEKDKYFPSVWIDRQEGELIDDVVSIEKINDEKFFYYYREANPRNLRKISTYKEKIFKTGQDAAEYYLRNILRLPGDLDGWKVVE